MQSSLLAIEAVKLTPGMKILDACAAPGMKTSAFASRLNNDCTLFANDMNVSRYKQMRGILHKFGVKVEKLLNVDFSQLDASAYSNLDMILLDPSCSGTGINRRYDFSDKDTENGVEESEDDLNKRCLKLASFQLILLEKAVELQPKHIVYCTCSVSQIENEDVVAQLLDKHSDCNYRVVEALPSWPSRGVGDHEFSKLCVRASLDATLTSGFFCSVLQRTTDEPVVYAAMDVTKNGGSQKGKGKRKLNTETEAEEENDQPEEQEEDDQVEEVLDVAPAATENKKKRKKKNKKQKKDNNNPEE